MTGRLRPEADIARLDLIISGKDGLNLLSASKELMACKALWASENIR